MFNLKLIHLKDKTCTEMIIKQVTHVFFKTTLVLNLIRDRPPLIPLQETHSRTGPLLTRWPSNGNRSGKALAPVPTTTCLLQTSTSRLLSSAKTRRSRSHGTRLHENACVTSEDIEGRPMYDDM